MSRQFAVKPGQKSPSQPAGFGAPGRGFGAGESGVSIQRQARARPQHRFDAVRSGGSALPGALRSRLERAARLPMHDVRVHYNSPHPARVGALAFTRGSEIHLSPGQEEHLAHEAWHVVQQKQRRVRATTSVDRQPVNDSDALEQEADRMALPLRGLAAEAVPFSPGAASSPAQAAGTAAHPIQMQSGKKKWGLLAALGGAASAATAFFGAPVVVPAALAAGGLYAAYRAYREPAGPGAPPPAHFPPQPPYTQDTDPSLTPFLHGGRHYIGEDAMRRQLAGQTATGRDVRVDAVQGPHQRRGAGLHEAIPTDMRNSLGGDPAAIGIQSGLRTATDLTLLQANGDVAAHTGHNPDPLYDPAYPGQHTGYTGLTGQATGHGPLRHLPHGATTGERVLDAAGRMAGTLATGPQILAAHGLTGSVPNVHGSAAIEPPAPPGYHPGPQRGIEAHIHHDIREHIKDRIRTEAQGQGVPSPVSPRRLPVHPVTGQGGGYGDDGRPASPRRAVAAPSAVVEAANLSAHLSAPGRHNPQSLTSTTACPHCGAMNRPSLRFCKECHTPL